MAKSESPATPQAIFTPASFFVFRTPLLPVQDLLAFSEGLRAASASDQERGAALAHDRQRLRAFLQEKLKDPVLHDALFIASPSLEESLPFWFTAPDGERGAKVEKSLVRYFQRMSGRPTPYGLFAGCSTGELSEATQLSLAPRSAYKRHTRLDMHYLCALTDALTAAHEHRRSLRYTTNSSLYQAAGRLRYIESRVEPRGRERSYHLVSVEPTDYLAAILQRASAIGGGFDDFRDLLVSDEISEAEAEEFIHSLIDSQLLVPLLEPPVTAPQPITAVLERLAAHEESRPLSEALSKTRALIEALDKDGLGATPARYQEIATSLEGLPAEVELPRLLQVDMTKPAPGATLSRVITAELARGLALLHRLTRSSDPLKEFKEKFAQRYEGREVPLVEALDDECGVSLGGHDAGEASPLLANLDFPATPGEPSGDARDPYLLRLLQRAVAAGAHEINLSSQDLEALSAKEPRPLPTSLAVMASLSATSAEAAAQGQFKILIEGASGPSGANLLGRFCHADPKLRALVEEHLRQEEALSPEEILAEIVHLPPGRVGNVICRPRLRQYEIPYLGCSSAEQASQLPVQDLMVSVQNGRVRLRSLRLNRYIAPRMSNAHNFAGADVGLYRFLCQLRSDGVTPGLGWSWGSLNGAPFLPRVSHERLVLETASWRLHQAELEPLRAAKGDQIFLEVQTLRQLRRLPRRLLLVQFDNTLPIDLDNVLSVEAFVALVKEAQEITLREVFPGYDALLCEGPEGRFIHELVVPFLVTNPTTQAGLSPSPKTATETPTPPPAATARSFAPGSRWLYAKLYTGTATADEVLTRVVRPLIELAKEAGAERWFFIRYGDPDWHVRLRIEGDPALLWQRLAPALYEQMAPLFADGLIWRMQLDTYEQEVERYGGALGMTLSERLFHADSEAALGILELLSGDAGNDARWRLALRGMDLLLDDLGLTLPEKRRLLQSLRGGFAAEFRAEAPLERQLDAKYRAERQSLVSLFDPAQEEAHELAPGLALLRVRSAQLAPLLEELRAAAAQGRLTTPLTELAASYLHMHANRLLRGAARAQELVLYDFLRRTYESQEARLRKKT